MIDVALGVLLILAAGAAAMLLHRRSTLGDGMYRLLLGAGCALAAVPALRVLADSGAEMVTPLVVPAAVPGGAWVFGIDRLSALFLLIILGVGAASAFFGVTYLARERAHRFVAGAHASLALLIGALSVVVTARAVVPFLIGWEVMAISSYVLIAFEHQRAEVRRAAMLYIVMTHTSMLALCALFAVWGNGAADLTFAALTERSASLPAGGAAVLLLALVGFGLKTGLVPFHIWLPEAHAAAPSHVSAYMSGVVIKMGVYGLMRVVVMLAAPAAAWWGWMVLGLGAASAVLGVIWALAQHDLKRLLAFHSVENIGIILIGLGAGVLGAAYGHPLVALLGFSGAALHTLNHSLFKSLLFLGAGSVIHATGARDIDRLGGLARRMPDTAAAFLVGAVAIVGLPPLNGFVSEWVVFRALLQGGLATDTLRFAVLGAAALALAGALALACFAKVVGIVYLGAAREETREPARESPAAMIAPMAALAGACILIGLLPVLVLPALFRVGASFVSGTGAISLGSDPALAGITSFALALGLGLLLTMSVRALVARRLAAAGRPSTLAPTWGCAYPQPTVRMQYTASSFAAPLMGAFRSVAGVRRGESHEFATHVVDPVLAGIVLPVWRGVRTAAQRLRPIQHGRIALYLLYIAAAVTILLLYLLFAAPGAR